MKMYESQASEMRREMSSLRSANQDLETQLEMFESGEGANN